MVDISEVYGSGELLKAADLQGHEAKVTIAAVEHKKFNDGGKLVITFQGKQKKLVVNKTNAGRIAFMYGTKTEGWIGKQITLYSDLVDFQGRTVDAIRVRPVSLGRGNGAPIKPAPQQQQISRPITSAEEDAAYDGIENEIPF